MYLLSSDFCAIASSFCWLDYSTLLFNCPYVGSLLFKLPSMILFVVLGYVAVCSFFYESSSVKLMAKPNPYPFLFFVVTKDSWIQLPSSWHSVDWFLICTESNTDRSTISHACIVLPAKFQRHICYIDHACIFTSDIYGLKPPPSIIHLNISPFGIPGWLSLCGVLLLQQVPSAILACTFSMHGGRTL